MQFEATPWPDGLEENPEAFSLEAAYTGIITAMSVFEVAADTIGKNRKLSAIAQSVEIDRAEQDANAELDRIEREELRHVQDDLRRQRDSIERTQVPNADTARRYQETRHALRELTVTKRKAALTDALSAKDIQLIEAVKYGTPLTCGMTTDERATFLEQAYSDELRNLEQATKTLAELRELITKAREFIESFEIEEAACAV